MSQSAKLNENEVLELKSISSKIRQNIVKTVHHSNSGHPGGSLSCTDIMTVLYFKVMKHFKEWDKHPEWNTRDRFVLSKGHCSPAFYSTLAQAGYIEFEELKTFRKIHSRLQGHPAYGYLPGIEVSTGSLGQGLSMSCGIALGLRMDNSESRVFTIMGDGELQEGQVWEAAMNAAHHKLGNLTAIVDRNKLQIDGCTENIKALGPLDKKWEAFGWHVIEIDGHDHQQIYQALVESAKIGKEQSKPVVIIANTVKGKGVSFMENNSGWHGKAPNSFKADSHS